jgi:hypothetical protein
MEWQDVERGREDGGGAAAEEFGFADGDGGEADAAALRGDDEERARARRRRRAADDGGGGAAAAQGSDTDTDADADADAEASEGAFAAEGWEDASLDGALRRAGGARKRARQRDVCWGCTHGITGGAECAQDSLRALVEFVSTYYGTMDDRVFATEVSKLHRSSVQRPQERLGKECDAWSARAVLEHFRHHTLHPRICDVQRLRSLRALSGELRKRVIRSYTDEDGERKQEVNRSAVALLLKVIDRETQLHRASNRQLFPELAAAGRADAAAAAAAAKGA